MMEFLTQAGKIAGLIAALCASAVVISKSPVGKVIAWFYAHLLGEPVGQFIRVQVGQVVDEKLLARNGGTTVPDAIERIDELARRQIQNHRENVGRLDAIEVQLHKEP